MDLKRGFRLSALSFRLSQTHFFVLLITGSLICFLSCKKNNNQTTPLPASHWTINGVTDSSNTVSSANNINFVCLTNDQQKSISVNFDTTVVRSFTYKVADVLQDSTECTITVNDGDSLIYVSTGKMSDSLYENISNHIITLTFNNISVHNSSNIVLVSGVLTIPSVY
jgi:hypothetical protein